MKSYKKRVLIKAEQWTDSHVPSPICFGDCYNSFGEPHPHLHTLEGNVAIFKYYWVAYGSGSEVWPISFNFFNRYYEEYNE